jgi:hypothetical protein
MYGIRRFITVLKRAHYVSKIKVSKAVPLHAMEAHGREDV